MMGKLRNHRNGFKPAHENAPGQFVLSALATGGAENEVCVGGGGPLICLQSTTKIFPLQPFLASS